MSFFQKGSSGGADGSRSQHDPRKKAQKGKEVLETDFDKEYNRLSRRNVLPTKWVNEGFLTSNGLDSDFTAMVRNADMEVFSALNCGKYKRATLEFLATFHADLTSLGQRTIVSFFVKQYTAMSYFRGVLRLLRVLHHWGTRYY
jgi:hypothetical protein